MLQKLGSSVQLQASVAAAPPLAARGPASFAPVKAAESQGRAPGRGHTLGQISIFPPVPAGTARSPDRDAARGARASLAPHAAGLAGALAAAAGPAPVVAAGARSVPLRDMIMPRMAQPAERDAVNDTIGYAPSVAQAGAVDPFGQTDWATFNMTNIVVTPPAAAAAPGPGSGAAPAPAARHYDVTATVANPITFNVASGGNTNIASENDAAINHANFPIAASDLTPNMASDGGRPPRTTFWAQDLTVTHERFHVNERRGFATTGVASAQTWLHGQTANSVADVQSLLTQVPGKVIQSSEAQANPGKEARAYGAGAPAYLARANAITAKGTAGHYPGAPAPPAPAPHPAPAH